MTDPRLQIAIRHQESGNLMEAARLYSEIIRSDPKAFEALYRLGLIHFQHGRFADAERLFASAIQNNPSMVDAFFARGCAMQQLMRHDDALKLFAQALALRPDYVEVRNNRGVSLLALKRYEEALASFDRVLSARPGLAMIESNRAAALTGLGRYAEALQAGEKAIRGNPNDAEAWYNKGAALGGLDRFEEAITAFDKALALNPVHIQALAYRGISLAMLGRHEEAIASYDKGLRIEPRNVDLLYNRLTSLFGLKRYEQALKDCEAVLALDPEYKYVRGCLVHSRLQVCDWRNLETEKERLSAALRAGKRVLRPLQTILLSGDESEQLQCSRIWAENDCPKSKAPLWRGERYAHERIRLAYVSGDFRTHAVASLMAGVFENHDRDRFETYAISLSREQGAMRSRMEHAFEHFIDVGGKSAKDAAALLRGIEVDIVVDLMGFTEGSETRIFAERPAPIQVNYLGFPGTMGADYIDYILVDEIVVPAKNRPCYTERLVHLPHSYLPADNARSISTHTPNRTEAGLPESGFVFCSFNNLAKIVPPMFDVWMRLLKQVEGSVLWLSAASPTAIRNLRHEASQRGVSGERLIFADFTPDPADHLARLSLADLFLDTLPYNAHAGGSDALWAGVPILTCMGAAFAGRVGASLLSALGVPELITHTLDAYETRALQLAREPEELKSIKAKLVRQRTASPLFDTVRFTRNLESAFQLMHERQRQGEAPAAFRVDDGVKPKPP